MARIRRMSVIEEHKPEPPCEDVPASASVEDHV
jgi:hypothetical protein